MERRAPPFLKMSKESVMVVAATGFFDGVHLGHRKVIERVVEVAKREGKRSAIISFWPHPRAVLQQDAAQFRLLTSLEEKKELLFTLGIEQVEIIPFDKEFAALTTEQFFTHYLKEKFNVSTLIAGYDHKVGSDTSQSQQEMFEIARKVGIEPIRVEQLDLPEENFTISSSKIRDALCRGDIPAANRMLGYNYTVKGVVVSGRKLGREIGFPTANIKLYEPIKLLPATGVYAVTAQVQNRVYRGINNIGTRPTVSQETAITIETHLINFNEEIYGLPMQLFFYQRIRDEKRFKNLKRLTQQLERDYIEALSILPKIDGDL